MVISAQLLKFAAALRQRKLYQRAADPRLVQEALLMRHLRNAEKTVFGRQHGFASIRTVAQYQANVPIRCYSDFRAWIHRAMKGEKDILWPNRTRYFGMSSGTTAGNKYLPLSSEAIRQQQRGGFDPLAAYINWTGDAGLLEGKVIMLGGSSALETQPNGAHIGDNTGIMANHIPPIVRSHYRPSKHVRGIADWNLKISALVSECLQEDIRVIAGTPSWFPGLFDRLIDEAKQMGKKVSSVLDLWPNLCLLTGGGVNYAPYRPLIEARVGRSVAYVDVYNATEGGIMGVQDRLDDASMLLIPDAEVFYELIPIDEIESDSPRRFPLWEAIPNQVYALAVSNPSGLWSYLLGDCLRFTQCFPHRFVFEGRIGGFLNVTGEHVSQGELDRAIKHACRKLDVRVRDYSVVADIGVSYKSGAQHVYLVEFDGVIPELSHFARCIDEDIRSLNGDYAAHRTSPLGLLEPSVRPLSRGAFDSWMKSRGKLGGQHKVPRVLCDEKLRDLLEQHTLPVHS